MNSRRLISLVVALAVAGVTAKLVGGAIDGARATKPVAAVASPPPRPVARILVAASDLPMGLLVQPQHLRWRDWPEDAVLPSHVVEGKRSLDEFAGAVVRHHLRAGEPVSAERLVKPGERGFLAALLNPDMRAVSVPINSVTGVAGLIFPGDRVDVILTHAFQVNGDPNRPERRAAETVLTDVRVLAIDQRIDNPENKPATGQIATLEVTPAQAERLPLIADLGQLSLSLRALARTDAAGSDQALPEAGEGAIVPAALIRDGAQATDPKRAPTWDSDISAALPDVGRVRKVQIMRGGGKVEDVTFDRAH